MRGRVFPCLLVYWTEELDGPVVVSAALMSSSLPPPCAAHAGADPGSLVSKVSAVVIPGNSSFQHLLWALQVSFWKRCSPPLHVPIYLSVIRRARPHADLSTGSLEQTDQHLPGVQTNPSEPPPVHAQAQGFGTSSCPELLEASRTPEQQKHAPGTAGTGRCVQPRKMCYFSASAFVIRELEVKCSQIPKVRMQIQEAENKPIFGLAV